MAGSRSELVPARRRGARLDRTVVFRDRSREPSSVWPESCKGDLSSSFRNVIRSDLLFTWFGLIG